MASSFFLTTVAAAIGFFTLLRKLRVHQDNQEKKSSSLSPSSVPSSPSLSCTWTHQVFPSFRGEDVRRDFLSHIQMEFQRMGITPFVDNEIKRGESIGPELIRAIRGSKIAIILLSRNYASSKWCLDELVEIMKCREELGQTVMAVFHKVDPSDVKKLTGDFGKVFRKTCAGKSKQDIGRWRQALAEVAKIAGYHSSNWNNEAAMIKKIATDISNMLINSTSSSDFDGLIGMRAHLEKMEPLICLESYEVRMIGIWGPPGIGKTTIARVLYNQLSNSFQLSAFMEDIKANYTRPCSDDYSAKLQLQKKFMSQITNQKDVEIPHLGVAQDRLKDKKVLVVLDGVDKSVQLDAVAKDSWWFGSGSRIIITTQDYRLFRAHGISHIYKVDFPPADEALQIFCMSAFGQKYPKEGFEKLAWEITNLAGELPLGLRIMGSYFRGMSKQEWITLLPRLETSLDADIQSILKFSYDALDDEDKDLFLHVACFFNGYQKNKSVEHLTKKFVEVRPRLNVLAEKSLISFNSRGHVKMHSLLLKLGREIVRKQSIHEPGQRQFLVSERDICDVLTGDAAGSKSVMGINFSYIIKEELDISEKAFEGMSNLQFLRLEGGHDKLKLSRGLNYLSRKLQLLDWNHFPMTCLPSIVNVEILVELNMEHSELEMLWEGIKSLQNLRRMDLSYSVNLKELPDLSTATNLRKLFMRKCSSLVKLPSSIGNAINLQELDLRNCSSLIKLPSSIGNATNLKYLCLDGCSKLLELPFTIGNAINLQELDLRNCSSLIKLPASIGNAINLRSLDLSSCSKMLELPSSIGNTISLQEMNLNNCSSLIKLPSSIGNAPNLERLYLGGCSSLLELPSSVGNAINLQYLGLNSCLNLLELPSSIGNAINLQELNLRNCSSLIKLPSSIGNATNLERLYLGGCSNLLELPSSIGNAINLQSLDLSSCSSLLKLPYSIGNAINLQSLDLSSCSSLLELPSSIGNAINLQILDLSRCSSLLGLPSSIGNATNLQKLNLRNCSSLIKLPSSIGKTVNLESFDLGNCSNLVELPHSIGNLQKLQGLRIGGCSKLEDLPTNINLESLDELDLTNCSMLKRFPEISTNVRVLMLRGTAIEDVPPSIRSWPRLDVLHMPYLENLKECPHALDSITELYLSDIEIQEVPPWIKIFRRLKRLVVQGCKKLVSLPQIPDSLSFIDAEDCESLERLDCSFHSPMYDLNFGKCFKLNQETRDLIIQTPTNRLVILPGREVPTYFTHRATGGGPLTVKLNEKPLPTSMRFKACVFLVYEGDDDENSSQSVPGDGVFLRGSWHLINPLLTEHLYTFEVEVEVTSSELVFEFTFCREFWKIAECGLRQLS